MAKRKGGDIKYKWLEERGVNVLANESQFNFVQSLWASVEEVQAVFCEARAGTGKTTLAVLCGAYEVEVGHYDKLVYVRNTIPLREMGFLPGTVGDKELPYMTPLIGALEQVQPGLFEKWTRADFTRREPPKVEAISTAFIRGLNWKRAYVILDEAQSFDLEELQTAYTRCDDDCKVVTLGSLRQNDNRKLRRVAGLTPFEIYMEHFKNMPMVAFHSLETNYRGWLSNHADDVIQTVQKLEGGILNGCA
ncbi:PhoH-like protein [Desulfotomaculum arcticum]|uniref:PhoH-like protein n=1 Tax=Desulfotruncus arcticus DSM 17038 TaxID=1121424 RepID=A0A1I2YDW5_9FIRM|nr:PhoH family protein [Desulfotruncus arcticus]SFH22611.1 PhoH-like protein [Desulfotomaculum arcticum] [Desulfotruncus arcticus DSM 17038]